MLVGEAESSCRRRNLWEMETSVPYLWLVNVSLEAPWSAACSGFEYVAKTEILLSLVPEKFWFCCWLLHHIVIWPLLWNSSMWCFQLFLSLSRTMLSVPISSFFALFFCLLPGIFTVSSLFQSSLLFCCLLKCFLFFTTCDIQQLGSFFHIIYNFLRGGLNSYCKLPRKYAKP